MVIYHVLFVAGEATHFKYLFVNIMPIGAHHVAHETWNIHFISISKGSHENANAFWRIDANNDGRWSVHPTHRHWSCNDHHPRLHIDCRRRRWRFYKRMHDSSHGQSYRRYRDIFGKFLTQPENASMLLILTRITIRQVGRLLPAASGSAGAYMKRPNGN